jgi:hypothetical protein
MLIYVYYLQVAVLLLLSILEYCTVYNASSDTTLIWWMWCLFLARFFWLYLETYYCSYVPSRCPFRHNLQYFHNSILHYLCWVFRMYFAYYRIFLLHVLSCKGSQYSVLEFLPIWPLYYNFILISIWVNICHFVYMYMFSVHCDWLHVSCIVKTGFIFVLFKYFSYILLIWFPEKVNFVFSSFIILF